MAKWAFGEVSSFLSRGEGKVIGEYEYGGEVTTRSSFSINTLARVNKMSHLRDPCQVLNHVYAQHLILAHRNSEDKVFALTEESELPNFPFFAPNPFSPPGRLRVF